MGNGVFRHFRPIFRGTLIANVVMDAERGNRLIAQGLADLVAFGPALHCQSRPWSRGAPPPRSAARWWRRTISSRCSANPQALRPVGNSLPPYDDLFLLITIRDVPLQAQRDGHCLLLSTANRISQRITSAMTPSTRSLCGAAEEAPAVEAVEPEAAAMGRREGRLQPEQILCIAPEE
jgi:hypothetical protein